MTRLAAIPTHLSGTPTHEPDPARVATLAELTALRAALSLCAARMVPTPVSIMREAERIEQIALGLRELAERI